MMSPATCICLPASLAAPKLTLQAQVRPFSRDMVSPVSMKAKEPESRGFTISSHRLVH